MELDEVIFDMSVKALLFATMVLLSGTALAAGSGQSPTGPLAYKDGWQDGCTSAHFASGNVEHVWKHDVARSTFDKLYKSGWTHGFLACKEQPMRQVKTSKS